MLQIIIKEDSLDKVKQQQHDIVKRVSKFDSEKNIFFPNNFKVTHSPAEESLRTERGQI